MSEPQRSSKLKLSGKSRQAASGGPTPAEPSEPQQHAMETVDMAVLRALLAAPVGGTVVTTSVDQDGVETFPALEVMEQQQPQQQPDHPLQAGTACGSAAAAAADEQQPGPGHAGAGTKQTEVLDLTGSGEVEPVLPAPLTGFAASTAAEAAASVPAPVHQQQQQVQKQQSGKVKKASGRARVATYAEVRLSPASCSESCEPTSKLLAVQRSVSCPAAQCTASCAALCTLVQCGLPSALAAAAAAPKHMP